MATATLVSDGVWSSPVLVGDVTTSVNPAVNPKYTDKAVLSIVVQDFNRASVWLNDRRWPLMWTESDLLYQSPRSLSVFEGSSVTRANVSRFTVAKQTNSIAPAISGAIFSDSTPFEIRPRPSVKQDTARAWKELIAELIDEIHMKQESSYGIQGMVNQGTVIFMGGWQTITRVESRYQRKQAPAQVSMPLGDPMTVFTKQSDEFEAVDVEITKNRPIFEKCELGTVFVDPTWNSPNQIWKARYIIRRQYLNYDDLTKLRDNPDYDIPSDEVLRYLFRPDSTEGGSEGTGIDGVEEAMQSNSSIHHAAREDFDYSEDPLLQPMEVLSWYSETDIRVVLQQKAILRNGPHRMPDKPFFAANYWDIDNAGYGMGIGRIAGADQRVEQGMINAILDILAYAVNPEYTILRGAQVPTQDQRRRLGGIRVVDGPDASRAISLVQQPQVPADAWRAIQAAISSSEGATGADQASVQGSLPGRGSSIGRSGTGAGMISAASSGRLQSPVERFIDGVFIPYLKFMWSMVKEFMPISEIRAILGDRAQDLVVDFGDFMDAPVKFDTLAGTRLAARGRMAQALPFLLEVLGNQALVQQLSQTGWKVDALELIKMVLDMSEWHNQNDLIVQMTPQEQQMMMAQNPGVLKAQAATQQQQQDQQFQMALEDKKIAGRIAVDAVDKTHKSVIESPLDRAASFAERTADTHAINSSQFFGPSGGGQ